MNIPTLELSLFPRLRYIGGAVGHRLDIFANHVLAKSIKISLGRPGTLALERIIIYGRYGARGDIENLCASQGFSASQSSVRKDKDQSDDEAEATYGAHRGANGIENGYDRFETLYEDQPYWIADFAEISEIATLHISNFCAGNQAYEADSLIIEYKDFDNEWRLIYDRGDATIIKTKYEKCLKSISDIDNLIVESSEQLSMKLRAGQIRTKLDLAQQNIISVIRANNEMTEILTDCIEAFLPKTLNPHNEHIALHNFLEEFHFVKIDNLQSPSCIPMLEITAKDAQGEITNKTIRSTLVELANNTYLSQLHIIFDDLTTSHFANSFLIKVAKRPPKHQTPEDLEWVILYNHAHNVQICQELAWTNFLAGNCSATSIGLIAKAVVLQRPDHADLQEAYLWCRLNLHGKSSGFKSEVESVVNSATDSDERHLRLKFGRHTFSTPLEYRDHNKYIDAIRTTIRFMGERGHRTMLMYGTLLGAVREGAFIPHDDDIDLGYLSAAESWDDLLEERENLINAFEASGVEVADLTGHIHLTFSVNFAGQADPYWIELFPIWKDAEVTDSYFMYMNLMTIQRVPNSIIGDSATKRMVKINGVSLPAPERPESFLELRYGRSWNIVDRFYEI